ncbi:MAG: Uma2 family endonuclease [Pleurocapsa sp. SU_196_0]|nr:Uma2 family endonuclease [Pleurocapsa sp. SU_196_0]
MTQFQPETSITPPDHLRHQFTVAEFERLSQSGVFQDKKVELIEGVIVEMPAMGDLHVMWMGVLTRKLVMTLLECATVYPQIPLDLGLKRTQPEPDFVIVKLENDHKRKPTVAEASFIIEVSDSTLRDDRTWKLELYARQGVKEYWILNVQHHQLEVYRDPEGETYKTKFTLSRGEAVTPLEFSDVVLEWWGNL